MAHDSVAPRKQVWVRGARRNGVWALLRLSLRERHHGGRRRSLVSAAGAAAAFSFCRPRARSVVGAGSRSPRGLVGLRQPNVSRLFVSLSEFCLGPGIQGVWLGSVLCLSVFAAPGGRSNG